MSKHIIDKARVRSSPSKFVQYARIESGERPQPQSKVLQKQTKPTDLQARAKRFLDIERQKVL